MSLLIPKSILTHAGGAYQLKNDFTLKKDDFRLKNVDFTIKVTFPDVVFRFLGVA